ncbi:malate nad-dependent [Ceraceosorus bombacis]|uniref:Malate dehydrogenase n=1 Tax=Ceraceosorus bombacis TaxID=401625 RepID=A0A0P1BTK7_9BASI|nr:malate nad-dependent [Ceraceosorus bombacis]
MVKATVIGAAGGIGQPLSLLLKQSTIITDLALYDVVNAPGVAVDISHIDTPSVVQGYLPDNDGLANSLKGTDIVVIPAGVPRKPGMTRDDLFNINAGIVRDTAIAIATHAPKAFVLVISNPVNSTVPVVAEVFKKKGIYDPKRLFGVTTLDVVRASTFVSEANGEPTKSLDYSVPIVGGHSGETIVPLLSASQPAIKFDASKQAEIVKRIQFGGDEVVKAKAGGGSATLSMAYAGARFAISVLEAAFGGKSSTEYSYIDVKAIGAGEWSGVVGSLDFFSVPVKLGKSGVESVGSAPKPTAEEEKLLKVAQDQLSGNISKGVQFVAETAQKAGL